jgi:hypothetical protein
MEKLVTPIIKPTENDPPGMKGGETGIVYSLTDFSPPGSSIHHVECDDGHPETNRPDEHQPQ